MLHIDVLHCFTIYVLYATHDYFWLKPLRSPSTCFTRFNFCSHLLGGVLAIGSVGSLALETTCQLQMAPPESLKTLEATKRWEGKTFLPFLLVCLPSILQCLQTLEKYNDAFALWRNNGWTIIKYRDIEQGTEQTSGQRLSAERKWNLSHTRGMELADTLWCKRIYVSWTIAFLHSEE